MVRDELDGCAVEITHGHRTYFGSLIEAAAVQLMVRDSP